MWHWVHDIVVLSVVFIIRQDPVVYTQELLGSGHVYLEGRLVVGQAVEILLMWYCGGDREPLQSWPLNQLIWCPLTWGQPQLHWLRPQVHALVPVHWHVHHKYMCRHHAWKLLGFGIPTCFAVIQPHYYVLYICVGNRMKTGNFAHVGGQ